MYLDCPCWLHSSTGSSQIFCSYSKGLQGARLLHADCFKSRQATGLLGPSCNLQDLTGTEPPACVHADCARCPSLHVQRGRYGDHAWRHHLALAVPPGPEQHSASLAKDHHCRLKWSQLLGRSVPGFQILSGKHKVLPVAQEASVSLVLTGLSASACDSCATQASGEIQNDI